MGVLQEANWIGCGETIESCPTFVRQIKVEKPLKEATLLITAIGVYEARLNGERIGEFVLAPGCTVYRKRLQYQSYDVTAMLQEAKVLAVNELTVTVGTGWYRGHISKACEDLQATPCAIIAELNLQYQDGTQESIVTDTQWSVRESQILSSDLYDGEEYDATKVEGAPSPVTVLNVTKETLIPQEGEIIKEHEQLKPRKLIISPKGERILDFGQNFAGYVKLSVDFPRGTRISLSHAEILDREGNFYTDNYREAKAKLTYICKEGKQEYKPHFTFYGFRYIRLDVYPQEVKLEDFTGIVLYSDMKRTGYIETGCQKLNRLYENTLWSQRANFIDIPTDCPQRDERMGWTGDAQVFAKTASYQYDVERFFAKWLQDVCAEQLESGSIVDIIPNFWKIPKASTAWGDAITIIPWQMYLQYGNTDILKDCYEAMKKWVDFMALDSTEEYLWTCAEEEKKLWGKHYGDWLALDAPYGSYKGATNDDYIASVFYAYSLSLLVKAGHVLGKNVSDYEARYPKIIEAIRKRFPNMTTQTDYVLALHFHIAEDEQKAAEQLVSLIRNNKNRLQTGFVGTPYLLHVLSSHGYADVAYDLLLQEEYPSWLYEVNHGATTIWEHWDGIRDDGVLWSKDMNSYNHYAYGSVFDWVYSVAGGIQSIEEYAGFEKVRIAPIPDKRLGWLCVSYHSRNGLVQSKWCYEEHTVRYEITTDVPALIVIDGREQQVEPGSYLFYS